MSLPTPITSAMAAATPTSVGQMNWRRRFERVARRHAIRGPTPVSTSSMRASGAFDAR